MGNFLICRSAYYDATPIRKSAPKSSSGCSSLRQPSETSVARSHELIRLATFKIPSCETRLSILSGPIVEFSYPLHPDHAAIVNAANRFCLGGGGVDGAISRSGGMSLKHDRLELPVISGSIRCPTGQAKLNGPGSYGELHVPYVIHAVGPNYAEYSNYDEPDKLLAEAYCASLDCAQEAEIEGAAFALISAGNYHGRRSLEEVLRIAIDAICHHLANKEEDNCIQDIFLCAFRSNEAQLLTKIARDMNLTEVQESNGATICDIPVDSD